MGPNEISDYVTEGMKWLSIGGGTYIASLTILNTVPKLFSERINSQEDLDRVVDEEANKLSMTKSITPKFHDFWIEASIKLDGGNYEIDIGGFGARRSTVRHELYHIHGGHLEHPWKKSNGFLRALNYIFREEPQAIVYGVFRLKL